MIDKTGLNRLPVRKVAFAFGSGELANIQMIHACLALFEIGLRLALGAVLQHGAVVF